MPYRDMIKLLGGYSNISPIIKYGEQDTILWFSGDHLYFAILTPFGRKWLDALESTSVDLLMEPRERIVVEPPGFGHALSIPIAEDQRHLDVAMVLLGKYEASRTKRSLYDFITKLLKKEKIANE